MKIKLLLCALLFFAIQLHASCPAGSSEIIVNIIPDPYDYEVSWELTNSNGSIIASADSSEGDTVCVPSGTCNIFTIHDAFGDGILNPGGYYVYVNGLLVTSGGPFGFTAQATL